MRCPLPLSCSFTLLIAAALPAQIVGGGWELAQEFPGLVVAERAGLALAAYGDWDGDGFDDFLIGAPGAVGAGLNAGSVYLVSGASGMMLLRIDGLVAGDEFGAAVAGIGDLDGDGWPEIVVGAPEADPAGLADAGSAFVYSGATGAVLRRFDGACLWGRLGASVAPLGDLDLDGAEDWLVGAPGEDPLANYDAGSVYVLSGATGNQLRRYDGVSSGGGAGASVAGPGDVDGDGFPDVLAGAPEAWNGSAREAGAAYLWSGSTGALLWQVVGRTEYGSLGFSVSGSGDLDGDGLPDALVGEPVSTSSTGRVAAGAVLVLSGISGAELRRFEGSWMSASLGLSVADPGDVDGDGVADVLAGAPGAKPGGVKSGAAYLYSGATGALIHRFDGPLEDDGYGRVVARGGERGGVPEVLVGAPYAWGSFPSWRGFVHLHAFEPYLELSADQFSVSAGVPAGIVLDFPPGEAGFPYVVLASLSGQGPVQLGGIEVPLSSDPLLQRLLRGWSPPPLRAWRGLLDPAGDAQAWLHPHSAMRLLVGRTLTIAAVSAEPGLAAGRLSSVARSLAVVL
ncbi:MAG: FG-GAP repeat protein [Planctomycetes bacterium]|nr:FG-GAP repeat protein [Planctomycetota bacterium]